LGNTSTAATAAEVNSALANAAVAELAAAAEARNTAAEAKAGPCQLFFYLMYIQGQPTSLEIGAW